MSKVNMLVYGTLRKGYGNHGYLKNSTFVGEGTTKEKYVLKGGYVPFVGKEPVHNVVVEAYEVPIEDLPNIDTLEGYTEGSPESSFYVREEVVAMVNGQEFKGWLYFCESDSAIIEGGDYKTRV